MDVYWLQQSEADVVEGNDWLGPDELLRLNSFRFPKRHSDWRLGRWTAKYAVAACQQLPLHRNVFTDIEICPTASGAPAVFISKKAANLTISISHRAGRAMCVVAPGDVKLGCDLEVIESHSDVFLSDYFTSEEQRRVLRASASADDRSRLVSLMWSAKESALKALRVGLRLDTRSLVVHANEPAHADNWFPLQVQCADADSFFGWWSESCGMLRTVVGSPAPNVPIELPAAPLGNHFTSNRYEPEPIRST